MDAGLMTHGAAFLRIGMIGRATALLAGGEEEILSLGRQIADEAGPPRPPTPARDSR